jgi:SAM-dependent methyltransferase
MKEKTVQKEDSLRRRVYYTLPVPVRPFAKTVYQSLLPPERPLWFDKSMYLFLESLPPGAKVLNLGSGNTRLEVESCINLDVELFEEVDVVGDGHQMPFIKDAFECVVCNAVLEHVANPHEVAKEIHRVLRVGGYACVQAPFLEMVHKRVDYFRFTLDGLRLLFANFTLIKMGVSAGPSQTVADIIKGFVSSFFYGTILFRPIQFIMGWVVFPIRWLDFFFYKKKSKYHLLDRAYYIIGQKN